VRITCETLSLYAPDAIVSSTSESNTPFHVSLMAGPKTQIPVLVLGVLRFFWHFLGRRFAKLRFAVVHSAAATMSWRSFLPTHLSGFGDTCPEIRPAKTVTAPVVTSSDVGMQDRQGFPGRLIKVFS